MSESLLEVSTRTEDAIRTLTITGELDFSTLPVFLDAVNEALDASLDVLTIDTRQ